MCSYNSEKKGKEVSLSAFLSFRSELTFPLSVLPVETHLTTIKFVTLFKYKVIS